MAECTRQHVEYTKKELAQIVFNRMAELLRRESNTCPGCYLDIQQQSGYTHSLKYHTCQILPFNYAKHPLACCELYKEGKFTISEFFNALRETEKRSLYHDYRVNKLSEGSFIDYITFLKFQIDSSKQNFEFPFRFDGSGADIVESF